MADNSSSSVHVIGFPKGVTDEQVTQVFAQYGAVKSVSVLPAKDDKPDAAAIITMDNADQAKFLIDNVSGTVPTGLTAPLTIKMKINRDWNKGYGKGYDQWGMSQWQMAQMMQYYGYGKGYGKGKGKGSGGLRSFTAEKKVWVGGLPEEGVTFSELQAHFPGSKFATVMKGKGAGTGGVAFATAEEATAAIQTLNGSSLGGNTIEVDVWTKKEKEEEAPTDLVKEEAPTEVKEFL